MLQKNQVVRAVIEGYSSEGLGIARVDGQVVFVHRAVRGEDCDIQILKVLKNTAFGRVVGVAAPSVHRQEPDCPYYGRCGGCDFRHMDYTEELSAKRQRVQDALTRLGGSHVRVEEILGSEDVDHYRNKSLYPIAADGTVGFFRARTHAVQEIAECRLQKPTADRAAGVLRRFIRTYHISCYDEERHRGTLRHLFVRTNAGGECLVCLVSNSAGIPHEEELCALFRSQMPECVGIVLCVNTRRGNAVLGQEFRTLWGRDTLTDTLCGLEFSLSVPSFYQVNREQAERLYRKAVEFAALRPTDTVLDLYCGAGTITEVMARHCGQAIGAEIVPAAIENAVAAAKRNGVENVTFFCGDAKAVAADFAAKGLRPDVICVDPPRKGLAPEVIEAVAEMTPERVVYVSCDPATLGRDVKLFAEHGYAAERAAAVDLFPRTAHVETVCLLSKHSNTKHHVEVELNLDEMDLTTAESKATYDEVRDYVMAQTGLHARNLNIAQIKRKCGIIERENYNLPKSEDSRQPKCTKEKEEAIKKSFIHFGMI